MSIFRRILHPPNRPTVNLERDREIFAYVEGLRRKGYGVREAYRMVASSGRWGTMSPKTAESAHRKARDRLRAFAALYDVPAMIASAKAEIRRAETRARLIQTLIQTLAATKPR